MAMYEGYCVKDREKVQFEGTVVELKNGRKAAQGICPKCGTKVMRILGKSDASAPTLGAGPPGSDQAGSGACGASSAGTVSFNPERSCSDVKTVGPAVRWWRSARSATVVRWKTPSMALATSPQNP